MDTHIHKYAHTHKHIPTYTHGHTSAHTACVLLLQESGGRCQVFSLVYLWLCAQASLSSLSLHLSPSSLYSMLHSNMYSILSLFSHPPCLPTHFLPLSSQPTYLSNYLFIFIWFLLASLSPLLYFFHLLPSSSRSLHLVSVPLILTASFASLTLQQ